MRHMFLWLQTQNILKEKEQQQKNPSTKNKRTENLERSLKQTNKPLEGGSDTLHIFHITKLLIAAATITGTRYGLSFCVCVTLKQSK